MTLPTFTIANIEEAEVLLNRSNHRHVVSIGEPGGTKPYNLYERPEKRVLRLEFDDVTYKAHAEAGGYQRATREQIASLIHFLTEVDSPVLFHCMAGVSRSTAAAVIYAAMKLGPGYEAEAVGAVVTDRGQRYYHPNKHMLRIADDLLNRECRLLNAIFESRPETVEHRRELLAERGT